MILPKKCGGSQAMALSDLIPVLCLASAFTAAAAQPCENTVAIADAVESVDYHLRLKPHKTRTARCTLVWNASDSSAGRSIVFDIPPVVQCDSRLGFVSRYTVFSGDSAIAAGEFTGMYAAAEPGFSAVLRADGTGSSVSLGGKKSECLVPVPFDSGRPGLVGYTSDIALEELRNSLRYKSRPQTEFADCESVAALEAALEHSDDPREGVWHYLDRDLKEGKAFLGGEYTIALKATADGGYDIVYLYGARYGADSWCPLMIKGRLRPTPFAGHYDLEWLDASGRALDRETSADFEIEGKVLRLNMPLYGGTLRFRRR